MGIIIVCVLVVIFLLLWAIIDIVPQSEARVMERLGIFSGVWGAGIHLKFPILDRCAVKVDLREQVMELPKITSGSKTETIGYNKHWDGYNKGYDHGAGAGALADATGGADTDSASVGFGAAVGNILTNLFIRSNKSKYSGAQNNNFVDYENSTYYSDRQGVITKDNVVMHVDAAVFYQVTDPKMYAYGMKQPKFALQKLTITTLRNIFGTLELDETLTSRELINSKLHTVLDEATDSWGIKITRVEIEEIIPPADIQKAMHAQASAERWKRADIIAAEGKKQADILEGEGIAERNRLLNETAPNEAIIKMLAIQAMPEVANGQSNTVIVPSELQGIVGLAKSVAETAPLNTKPAN
ncbi:MAG: paraslipin [Ruminococcaceae bacterium]|nr:paraslipin [Oscillospiraceae bacterium]